MRTARQTIVFALLLAATPALAQPADDPFEAIVANPDGANARLNDVSIPVRNPTEDELRQYLEAFRAINMSANFTVDPRSRNARLGPFRVKGGTDVRLKAGFTKRRGEKEAVLRTLEMVPTNPMSMGPLRFNKMTLDGNGVLHFKLNLNLMGFDFWPQEMTVEKIYRDRSGNLIFKTGGSGLAGAFGPDLRITKDGRVQRYSKGFLGLFGKGWKDLKDGGKVVRVPPETIPITRWPPGATDILNWLPQPTADAYPAGTDIDALRPVVEAVPVSALNVKFSADADPRRITLSDGEGHLDLSNHRLEYEANGRFEGRTYVSDPTKRNAYKATARVTGEVDRPGIGRARIDGLDVELNGEHSGRIPFEDPSKTHIEGSLNAKVRGEVSDMSLGLPGAPTVHAPGRTRFAFDGNGKLILRPYSENEEETKELVISRDSRYSLTTDGPVEVEGLDTLMPGHVDLPDRARVVAADDPTTPDVDESTLPVFTAEGDMGTKMGFVFARPKFEVHGELENGGVISALEDREPTAIEFRSTLKPGARLDMRGYMFAGIKQDDVLNGRTAGGVRTTADAHIRGTGTNTRVVANGMTIDLPGETDVDARVATNTRYGTRNGAEVEVREVVGRGSVTLREGEGHVSGSIPGQPGVTATVAPGTRVEFDTGRLRRANVGESTLETEGYARGERGAKVRAHLVLTAGTIAHRDLALAFRGRTEIDLDAAIGFRFDPVAAETAGRDRTEPMFIGLDLGIHFAQGSKLKLTQPGGTEANLTLSGNTSITLHTNTEVDSTGSASLSLLEGVDATIEADGVDLKTMLGSAVTTTRIGSRTRATLRNARIELLERGMRIHHDGISLEIAAGTIEVGTR